MPRNIHKPPKPEPSLDGGAGFGAGGGAADKRNSAIGCNIIRKLRSRRQNRATVIALPQQRNHRAACISGAPVRDDRLKPVADFDSILPQIRSDQQQDAAAILLVADAKLLIKVGGVVLDTLVTDGMDRHNRNLRAGFLFDLGAQRFELCFCARGDYSSKIGDVSGRVDALDVLGANTK